MANTTRIEGVLEEATTLAAAARDGGMEKLEGAKGQLADGAERVAAAVDRTADELDGEADGAISGFGHSIASLMRQLAGGLRERDVEEFARELGGLARRNPGVFLAGSVALGFGVARFFKASAPQRTVGYDSAWRPEDEPAGADREAFDAEESLDLSGNPANVQRDADDGTELGALREPSNGDAERAQSADGRGQAKSRSTGKKSKTQRAATGTSTSSGLNGPATDEPESEYTGETGGKGS